MRRLLTALLPLLAACADAGTGSGTLRYYLTADPVTLDPALSTDVQSGEVVALIYDNLVQFDVDGQLVPGLATRWEADSAGTTYTFHLRSGVTFQDGRPVTARDVEASVLRALAPGSRGRDWPLEPILGARAYAEGTADAIDGMQVLDDSTIAFRLAAPLNVFPKLMAMPVAAVVPTPTPPDFGEKPVGSGPWRLVSWTHDNALLLARNEGYWGAKPKSDSLRIRIIPETATQAAEFETGQLSLVEIPFGETRRWEENFGDQLERRPAIRDLYISINTGRGPLRDVRVRRALNLAVDVETILNTVMAGRGVRAAGAIPPGIAGHDPARQPYRHDPAEARRLLGEAGYPNGFSLQLWRSQRAELARVAQAVQQDLASVGITVEILQRDATSVRAAVRNGETDLYLGDWYADYPDPENFTWPLFHSSSHGPGGNYAFLDDPAVDSMIQRLRTTGDETEKERLARRVDQRIFELAPWIFLWFPVDVWATQEELTGWEIPLVFTGQRWIDAELAR
ncbi:MAG TPA: ABC transporter substrate-binding protein [Gemmatimonadales bacterium]|nr:ABC transporter substrate-binding protein [Gemmatimonadales bacterium]